MGNEVKANYSSASYSSIVTPTIHQLLNQQLCSWVGSQVTPGEKLDDLDHHLYDLSEE